MLAGRPATPMAQEWGLAATEMRRDEIAKSRWPARHRLAEGEFAVVTLHRPSNVDEPERLAGLVGALERIARHVPLVLPLHPRTRGRLAEHGWQARMPQAEALKRLEPLAVLDKTRAVGQRQRFIQTENRPVAKRAERLRLLRALEALEHASTAQARESLTELAGGTPTTWLTREAAAARNRLAR